MFANLFLSSALSHEYLRELVDAMQDKDAGISLDTHKVQDNKVYRHCFTGTLGIKWI